MLVTAINFLNWANHSIAYYKSEINFKIDTINFEDYDM